MTTQNSEVEIRALIIRRTLQLHDGSPSLLPSRELIKYSDAYDIAKREVELELPIPVGIMRDNVIVEAKDLYKDFNNF